MWGAHDTGSIVIVLLALLRVLPVLAGSKACRKLGLGAVLMELRTQIPDNGAGPLVAERRDAVLFLENLPPVRALSHGAGALTQIMRELVFVYLASRREFRDADRCGKALVGPMRRYLAAHDGAGFADWDGLPPDVSKRAAL